MTTEVTNGLESAVDSFSTISELTTGVWNMMTANPLLTLLLGVSLLGIGILVFKKIKRAVR